MGLRPDWRLLAHLCLVFSLLMGVGLLIVAGSWQWHQKNLAARHNNPLHGTRH